MLQVKNLKKSYKSKRAGETKALKGIDLTFGDKGLVFVLGKSGCGKSTLLNLLGGLDSFDEGEIIINGKSSKDFTRADFDSYRNTYLGFVFQEFNIIENFSIAKNIGLALQLQHKKSDKAAVNEILKKVELEGFGERKPNELSGGQKQRVAIARALIKDPEIILADEPTGALDSATGKAVLNMLRKLSEDKLVIIVSHDREFAEEYADRIVELKDGLVISDRTRVEGENNEKWKEEILPITSELIRIPKGKPLDERTITEINETLLNAKTDTYLMLGEESHAEKAYPEVMEDVKAKGYISANTFVKTEESEIKSDKKAMALIKSKLPLRDAFKIGASNFGSKKFRLVFTIFLSVLSLCFFGFADIFASYDRAETYANAFYGGDAYYMKIGKVGSYGSGGIFDGLMTTGISFSKEDVENLEERYGGGAIKCYNFDSYSYRANFYKSSSDQFFQPSYYNGYLVMEKNDDIVAFGRFPETYDEIMISDYMAKGYIDLSATAYVNGSPKEYVFDNYDQLMGHVISIGGKDLTIVGVYKTSFYYLYNTLSQYNEYDLETDSEAQVLSEAYYSDLSMYYNKVVVKDGFDELIKDSKTSYDANMVINIPLVTQNEYVYKYGLSVSVDPTGQLKKGEIIIPASYYKELKYGYDYSSEETQKKTYSDILAEFNSPQELECYVPIFSWETDPDTAGTVYRKYYNVVSVFDDGGIYSETYGDYISTPSYGSTVTKENEGIGENFSIYMSQEDFDELLDEIYLPKSILVDARMSGEDLHEEITFLLDNNYSIEARNESELSIVDSLMDTFVKIFYIVAAVLAVFVILLLYNFMSTSVVNKKKEIGILRAIGARGMDVAKIFIVESLLIGAIVLAIVFPTVIILTDVLQNALLSAVAVKIISFKARQVFTITGITLLILIISSVIPVARISSKKPIDAILNK